MSDASPDLRVPKHSVFVELALVGGPAREVEVYLAEHKAHAYRPQAVLDLLEDEPGFLPARDRASGEALVVNRRQIALVAITPSANDGEEELYELRRDVRVELAGGTMLTGQILYTAAPERARIVDYVNEAGGCFRLWQEGRVVIVAKAWVTRIVETAA